MSNKEIKATISADNKKFKRGIDDSKKQVTGFEGTINKLKTSLGVLAGAAAIGAVVKGLFNMAKEVGNTADRLLDLEQITGLSTDTLQEYEHVARVAGVNSEFMATSVQGLTQRLARGAEMSAGLRMGINALGIEVMDGAGNLRDLGKVTEEAIDQLAGMEDIAKRNVIGAQLFSGAWKDLAPVLALGKDGIEAAKQEARDLGLVMSKDSLEAANEFRIEMETLNAQWGAAKRDITMLFLPALEALVKGTSEAATGIMKLTGLASAMGQDDSLAWYEKAWTWTKLLVGGHKGLMSATQDMLVSQAKLNAEYEKSGQAAIDRAEAERKAAEAAEAARLAGIEAEKQRRYELGEIGRIEEDLAQARKQFTAANTEAERARAQLRITNLEAELQLLKEIANQGAVDLFLKDRQRPEGMQPITAQPPPDLMDGYNETLRETIDLTRQAGSETEKLGETFQGLESLAYETGAAMGNAFGLMATEGKDATKQIINQMLAQVVAALIRNMAMTLGPAGALLAGAAPGLAHAMFSSIPSYASGTSNHPGGMALVGERGPEIVDLPGGSSVYTNSESMGMMGGKVEFEIRGEKLYGVLKRHTGRLSQNT